MGKLGERGRYEEQMREMVMGMYKNGRPTPDCADPLPGDRVEGAFGLGAGLADRQRTEKLAPSSFRRRSYLLPLKTGSSGDQAVNSKRPAGGRSSTSRRRPSSSFPTWLRPFQEQLRQAVYGENMVFLPTADDPELRTMNRWIR